jgi:hypothetical protein
MSSQIVSAEIGLGLDDNAGGAAMHQKLAQKIAGYFDRGTVIEVAFEDGTLHGRYLYTQP